MEQLSLLRLAHVLGGQSLHRWRQRGTQQQRLPLARTASQDLLHIGAKADIQHAIGLVQHDAVDGVQRQCAPTEMVEHASRSPDDNLDAALQLGDLAPQGSSAVDGHAANSLTLGQFAHFVLHLHGQFARRDQDQGLGILTAVIRVE